MVSTVVVWDVVFSVDVGCDIVSPVVVWDMISPVIWDNDCPVV